MKKFFLLSFFILNSFFPIFSQKSQNQNYAEILENSQKSQNHENQKYNSSITEIKAGNNSLFVRVYYFNSMEEGSEIAQEIYGIKNFSQFEKVPFTKLKMMNPGDELSAFSYGMFKNNNEFWLFENKGDGWLWGKGFFINK